MGVQNQIDGKKLLKIQDRGQPKNLVVLRATDSTRLFDAHPLVDAYNARYGTKLTVVSYNVADVALTVGKTWQDLPSFPVDAVIAYEKPGTKLGKEVVYCREDEPKVVLATGKYAGLRDAALVTVGLSSADFKKDWNSIVLDIPESRLILVPSFPQAGWYMPHEQTGVPHGEKAGEAIPDARYLYRVNGSYVGLQVRNAANLARRRSILAVFGASTTLGVVAEVPDADVGKIESVLSTQSE